MSGKITVMLVDDHAVVRVGFRLLLEAVPEISTVAEAESGEEACRLYAEIKPHVVVMDLAMPGMGGIEAVNRIMARDRGARILALSAHEDTSHSKRVLKVGALGYLSKRSAPEAVIDAVREVAAGRMYLDPAIAQRMAVEQLSGAQQPVDILSEREFEVFLHLARGESVNQIAGLLKLSPRTVGTHLYNIKQKLRVGNHAELTLLAVRCGLIDV